MPITLSRAFDTGRYNTTGTASPNDATIAIRPSLNWLANGSSWQWFAVQAEGVNGLTPSVVLNAANRQWSPAARGNANEIWMCVWSYSLDADLADWKAFDNVSQASSTWTFSNTAPFTQDTVYIAHYPIYPYVRIARRVSEWVAHPHVQPITGGASDYVVATIASQTDDLGRTVPALPIHGFIVSDPTSTEGKVHGVLSARQHCDEQWASWVHEAGIDWLLGDHPDALWLRQHARILVLPCLNPDGVWAGYVRSTVGAGTVDMNRAWYDGSGVPHVPAILGAIAANVPDLAFALDYHNLGNVSGTNPAGSHLQTADNARVQAYLTAAAPFHAISFLESTATVGPTSKTISARLREDYAGSLALCGALEDSPQLTETPADRAAFGVASVRALRPLLETGAIGIVHDWEYRSAPTDPWTPLAFDVVGGELPIAPGEVPTGALELRVRGHHLPSDTYSDWATWSGTAVIGVQALAAAPATASFSAPTGALVPAGVAPWPATAGAGVLVPTSGTLTSAGAIPFAGTAGSAALAAPAGALLPLGTAPLVALAGAAQLTATAGTLTSGSASLFPAAAASATLGAPGGALTPSGTAPLEAQPGSATLAPTAGALVAAGSAPLAVTPAPATLVAGGGSFAFAGEVSFAGAAGSATLTAAPATLTGVGSAVLAGTASIATVVAPAAALVVAGATPFPGAAGVATLTALAGALTGSGVVQLGGAPAAATLSAGTALLVVPPPTGEPDPYGTVIGLSRSHPSVLGQRRSHPTVLGRRRSQ